MGQAKARAAEIKALKTAGKIVVSSGEIDWNDVNKGYEPCATMCKTIGLDWKQIARKGLNVEMQVITGTEDVPKLSKPVLAFSMPVAMTDFGGHEISEFAILAGMYEGFASVMKLVRKQLHEDMILVSVMNMGSSVRMVVCKR